MGFFDKFRSAKGAFEAGMAEVGAGSATDEIGFRYRSGLSVEESYAAWVKAVDRTYGLDGEIESIPWSADRVNSRYTPFNGNGMIGAAPSDPPQNVWRARVKGAGGPLLLAAWPKIVSMPIGGSSIELWSVTPEHPLGLERQAIERHWDDSTLSRLGSVELGLWGA